MKISIITITKNNASGLLKTIKSVITQTIKNIEYIIVDGQSNDETTGILKNLSPEIRIISEPDTGIYNAMNKGVNIATGDYIMFLNSGDYFIADYSLEFWLKKIYNKNARVFFSRILWHSHEYYDISVSDHHYIDRTWHLINDNFPHSASLYHRSLFVDFGNFDEKYQIMADYEFNLRILIKERVKYHFSSIVVSSFFANGISVSKKNKTIREQENKIIKHLHFSNQLLQLHDFNQNLFNSKYISKLLLIFFKANLNKLY